MGKIGAAAFAVAIIVGAVVMAADWIKGPVTERFIEGVRVVGHRRLARATRYKNKAKRHTQIMFGEVPWPAALQDKHALIVGTTGVGKSTLIRQLLPRIRAGGGRAIVVDLNGEFAAQFLTANDKVFNPLDPKGVKWNPLAEISSPEDMDLILKASIPTGSSPEDENWRGYARRFLQALMQRLLESGELRMDRLRYYVKEAGDKELAAYLQGGKNPYRLPDNNMISNIKTLAQNCVQSLEYGAADAEFSIREWVRTGRGFIFITPKDRDRAALSTLINAFMNLAIAEALSAPTEKRYKPISVVIDELSSFYFEDFAGVLEKGRKFGLVAFAGIQNIAQLRQKYGSYGATVLLACFRTKIIFNPGDMETAKNMSEEIGRQIVSRLEVSYSQGSSNRSTTSAWRPMDQPAVSPEMLRKLADLTAYVKFGGDYSVAKITLVRT